MELIKQQEINSTQLQQAISNFKKSPLDRKTLKYLQQSLDKLTELWVQVNKTDRAIRNNANIPETHDYYTSRHYETVSEKYNDIVNKIEEEIKILKNTVPSSNPDEAGTSTAQSPASNVVPQNLPGKIKNGINAVKELLKKAEDEQRSAQFLTIQLRTIKQHWAVVQKIHEQLWTAANDSYDIKQFLHQEATINEEIFNLEHRIRLAEITTTSGNGIIDRETQQSITTIHNMPTDNKVNLPKIDLPKFDGDYLKWRNFYDLFSELVDKSILPPCQKLLYLKTSLFGEAASLIQNYATTTANYDIAWKTLKDRYENKRVLVNALLKQLFSQSASVAENVTSLKLLHDTTYECLRSLNNLGVSTNNWDPIMIHFLVQRLNKTTHMLWEQSCTTPQELPSLSDFLDFIKRRFQTLEAMETKQQPAASKNNNSLRALGASISTKNCVMCKQNHHVYVCPSFLEVSPKERLNIIQKAQLCVNCLKGGHKAKTCTSSTCKKCHKKHNSLLHLENALNSSVSNQHSTQVTTATACKSFSSSVLLSTVCIYVTDGAGNKQRCRALLDSGSQANFISDKLTKRLGLPISSQYIPIEGIGQSRSKTSGRINIEISSTCTGFATRIEAHILRNIVSHQPHQKIDIARWNIPANIQLSDPDLGLPSSVDILIGAGIFYSVLCVGQIALGPQLPTLQNTLFGWVAGGEYSSSAGPESIHCGVGITDISDSLEKFWKLEDIEAGAKTFTSSEQRCENQFLSNIRKHVDGRFIVKLPFEMNTSQLGTSRDIALQRFYAIERKLERNPQLRMDYIKFMREYEALKHMEEITPNKIEGPHYFLPHHAVFKLDSTTTKVRVVFDASAKTSSNYSLNDVLATGPRIQSDVFTTVLRFRFPRFVFTADIEKMYRQIWVCQEDRKFQHIWWRESPDLPLRCMQLATVTYGTTCAPYLATRILKFLADTNQEKFPLAAKALSNNFYVDDVLTGADSITTALNLQSELCALLTSAGLHLRKWCSNDSRLLNCTPANEREISLDLPGSSQENIKAMGIKWFPKEDAFTIKVTQEPNTRVTKRTALADISRLFDPLGFISPVVTTAKIFLQQLWKLKLDWDASLPQDLHSKWLNFRQNLTCLEKLHIPRHIYNHRKPKTVQLHVFSDASEKAYGAVAYIRTTDTNNIIISRLLCSKSRVTPVKQVSLPRLELCAAKLAIDLVARLNDDKILPIDCQIFYWTDSTAVLGWINATSANYHTFVANRISAIQQVSDCKQWHHVRTDQNPADLLSRGIMPDQLIDNTFWFYGPLFLHAPVTSWPLQPPLAKCTLEIRQKMLQTCYTATGSVSSIFKEIDHRNCLRRFQRILAYVLKFIDKTRASLQSDRAEAITGTESIQPSAKEMEGALQVLVRLSQQEDFAEEIKSLRKHKAVHNDSSISSLSPFVDDAGILRVGGRLQSSELSFDAKHQMLLSYHHPLTKMLFDTIHKEKLHVGAQTLLAIVRERFWPLKGKNIARSTIQKCVPCTKNKPKLFQQLMGALPKDRVQPARPFMNAGVDFFGPVWVHFKIRGKQPLKSYVAVFCCFSTKAVHLELVSDLSTEAFLGALRRFMARRGQCSRIYCDNATNFIGAKNQLNELNDAVFKETAKQKIHHECIKKNIEFSFIPPRAPHFGGLWEAAVKSAKHLLQSSVANANLTHEELETLLTEVEAIMNSRPLTPMSSDPHDLLALTPGHFLIGEPLTATADPYAHENNLKPLARWKLVTQLKRNFWTRWTNEYLHSLQHRYKWKKQVHDITPNTMVLIKEDNLPTYKWSLGRIKNVIRGEDGLVRVADVQTARNIVRRPITKLAPLPTEGENDPEYSPVDNTSGASIAKRARLTPTILSTILIAVFLLPLCMANSVELQPFQSNPGIYFEKLGTAHIITSEWDIISYVNMSSYWKWNERIKRYPDSLTEMCRRSPRPNCATVISLIKHLISEIDSNNQLLKHNQNMRVKRGAINIVGNIANSLFGVLDESYAADMAEIIHKIKKNEESLENHMHLQKSFLDTTLNMFKKDQTDIEREFQRIESSFKAVGNQVQVEKNAEELNELTIQTMLIMYYLQRIQESLLDVLTDSHHGKINPELIPPEQLNNELTRIKGNLPDSLKLPAYSDILKLYKIMKIEARVVNNLVIFNLKVPLVMPEQFELLKLTPVPWSSNGKFQQIKTRYTFLVINLHRDQYYPLEEKTLRECFHIENNNYLCHQGHIIHLRSSSVAECEVNILNQLNETSQCSIEAISPGPHWAQLNNPNWWVYAIDGEMVVNTVCDNNLSKLTLKNTGLVKLLGNCEIKQPSLTIRGYRAYSTSKMEGYIPDIQTKNFTFAENTLQTSNNDTHISKYIAKTSEIENLQEEFRKLGDPRKMSINTHDIHHYLLGYICLISVFTILGYLIWKQRSTSVSTKTTSNSENEITPSDGDSHIITICS